MKVHRHLVEEAARALEEIFTGGAHADKAIEKRLKTQKKWGARDRRFFAESVYECVRWWRRLDFVAGTGGSRDARSFLKVWAAWALEHGWIDEGETWGLDEDLWRRRRQELTDAPRALRESVPDWLDARGTEELGERWPAVLSALNRQAPVDLRVNSLKTDRETLARELAAEEVETEPVPDVPSALTLKERKNVFRTRAFQRGGFEVQDRASQRVAPLLDPQPGERIADACAGAGGKSLHLAALMKNRGRILSLDIHEWKLKELRVRAARAGADIIETRLIESSKTVKRLEESFDRVLLDVPCSGMGVLRRNPDSKWKLSPEEIDRLLALQSEILRSYSRMVKPGGVLVYATCSLLPSENSRQVERFQGEGWRLLESLSVLPDEGRGDGFYAAKLQRDNAERK